MKNITLMFVLFIFSHLALADTTCKAPEPSAVIYFGNGINTTKHSAAVSLSRLNKELGADYNSHRLEYALAYNESSGMALDLAQASDQLAIQINSRLMLWFSGEGIAPGWLASWYQDYLLQSDRNG